MRPTDRRHGTSMSAWTPQHGFGDVGVGGKVIGIAGFDLPSGDPTDGQWAVFDSSTGEWVWTSALELGDAEGAIAIRYTFSTTTTDSDPGAGVLRLSNATQYSAVTCRADLLDVAGADVTNALDLIGLQTGTTLGYLRLQKTDDPTKWLLATVSAIASPAGYRNVTIANIAKSANSPFADGDPVTLVFVPSTVGLAASSSVPSALTIKDEGTPLATAAASLDFVGAGVVASGAGAAKTITIPGGGSGTGTPGWFNVKDPAYGAVGDGVTDDRAACQLAATAAAVAGGILYFPRGSYKFGSPGLVVGTNVTVLGEGRESTFILAGANSINLITITGTAIDSTYEIAHASTITGIEFGANGHTGVEGIGLVGVAYWAVNRCTVRGLAVGIDAYGSLQGWVDDCKVLSNTRGIKYSAQTIGYYGGTLPPNRVIVSRSTFYYNTTRALEAIGGQMLALDDCEFGDNGTAGNAGTSAIKFTGPTGGDPHGPGLIGRNLWLEANHGLAVIEIADCNTTTEHVLEDCWLAYNDSTRSISLDSTSASQSLLAKRVHHDTLVSPATVDTFYRTGSGAYLDLENCNGTLAGSGGVVRQDPLLDETKVTDLSQFLALRLPNLTTTQRDAIAAPTAGMLIWNTTTTAVNQYTGSAWTAVAGGISGFAVPALTLGTAAAAGVATTAVRTDATLPIFDTTAVADVAAVGVASSVGTVPFAARRNHGHALTYHDEPLTDGASNFIFDGGDVVVVTGVPN